MKKLFSLLMIVAVAAGVAGCFTKAAAHATKTTLTDGTVILESDVSIVGTGDKASEIAAEGLFADGADDTLGAGVKNAKAAQQSTGIKETLEGMGSLLGGIGQLMLQSQGLPVGGRQTLNAQRSTLNSQVGNGEGETLNAQADSETEYSGDGYGGAAGTDGSGVYGKTSCAGCRAYRAAHPDIELIDIGKAENKAAMWAALRRLGYAGTSVSLPVVVTGTGFTQAAK